MSCGLQREVRLDGRLRRRVGGGRGEGRRVLQDLVDRRRFVLLFGEAVALGERRDFVGVDAIDQPIEVLAQPRVGAGAVRRFEQNVDGLVELLAGLVEVAGLELALAGVEMTLRGGDEGCDRIERSGLRAARAAAAPA